VPVDAKETGNDPEPRPRRVGVLAVARTIFFGLLMIGRKETWETNGIGARMTPGQIVIGALVGGIVLVGVLVLIVRIAIGLAAG
jgi:hypothetical protein